MSDKTSLSENTNMSQSENNILIQNKLTALGSLLYGPLIKGKYVMEISEYSSNSGKTIYEIFNRSTNHEIQELLETFNLSKLIIDNINNDDRIDITDYAILNITITFRKN